MACWQKYWFMVTISLLLFLLCFTLVHSAAIRKKAKNLDLYQLNDSIREKDIASNKTKQLVQQEKLKEELIPNNPDSVLQQPNKAAQITEKKDKDKDVQSFQNKEIPDSVLLMPDPLEKRRGNIASTKRKRLKMNDKKVNLDEEGAGESILKLVDNPVNGKPLPIVKASNKIDAIVQVRDKSKTGPFGKGKIKLNLDDLQPPDHLDAVRMEQDGHLNRDYKKEIFLGNHEEMDSLSDREKAKKLKQIFKKVDVNKNKYITVDELEDWIIDKVNEHFREASRENQQVFKALDSDNDGFITWREFHVQFLIKLGLDEKSAEEHAGNGMAGEEDENYDGINNSMQLESEDRERLVRFKLKWSEADSDPQDNQLSLDEFQAFRHPEQSKSMLQNMVQDIIDNLDKDQNGVVSEREFVALPPAGVGPELHEADKQWQAERRKEFRNVIDTNRDGKLTKVELLNYVDPQNANHAKLEARNLIDVGDSNKDDRLSLQEVLDNMDLFIGSKMVDTGRSFHDEF